LKIKNIKEELNMDLQEIISAINAQKELIEAKFGGLADQTIAYETAMKNLQARIDELEKKLAPNKVSVPGSDEQKEKFSWMKAFYGIYSGDWSAAGFEKEVFDAVRQKATMTTQGTGQYIIPIEISREVITMLEARSVLDKVGVTKMTNLNVGTLSIPKQTGGATAYWVGEDADITPSELTFGMVDITPKQVAAMVISTDRLLRLSNPSIEQMIKQDVALRLALKKDLAGLRGTGTSTQPRGIANTPGINTVSIGPSGGPADFDTLIDMQGKLEDANALFGNLFYIWPPKIRRALMKLKVKQYSGDTAGEYILQPVTPAMLQQWIGYPYESTTQIPTNLTKGSGTNLTEIYFGNFADLISADWGSMQIMVSQETSTAFQKAQTWIRIIQDCDFAVRNAQSFCLCNDASY